MNINCATLPKATSRPTRRRFFAHVAALTTSPLLLAGCQRLVRSEQSVTPAGAFDKLIEDFMKERGTPGGALAVVKDRRLVHAQGYGWADGERKIAATPQSLFRLASVSKPITAVAVLTLVEQQKVSLDQYVFELLGLDTHVPKGARLDERWRRITVRQLLQHTGGWSQHPGEPMFIAKDYLVRQFPDLPAGSPWAVIRFQLTQPLNFDPGTRFAYSGFGYCLLGRVIEKVTGQTYETFVQQTVLAPAGIKRMRVGRSLERVRDEVHYYDQKNPRAPSDINFEAMDSGGGWIGSAVDLGRFAAALDDPKRSPVLKRPTLETMYARPPGLTGQHDGDDAHYGCGWCVRPLGGNGKANYWHYGDLPGTDALLVRFAIGFSIAVLFNQRSENNTIANIHMDAALKRAATTVTDWPKEDLFERYS